VRLDRCQALGVGVGVRQLALSGLVPAPLLLVTTVAAQRV
jgi:hypothetical protein